MPLDKEQLEKLTEQVSEILSKREKTIDNQILRFRVATFIAITLGLISLTFTVSGIIFTGNARGEQLITVDGRVTKTSNRNAVSIEKNHEDIKELTKEFYEYQVKQLEKQLENK